MAFHTEKANHWRLEVALVMLPAPCTKQLNSVFEVVQLGVYFREVGCFALISLNSLATIELLLQDRVAKDK